jgi:threonine aldolase
MHYFLNDYTETAHPNILNRLMETNYQKDLPYGLDGFCAEAAEILRLEIKNPDAGIHFLVGGTQTNLTALSAFLRPYEAIIAADTAHIATNETGAIEATGHKIITVQNQDGKITAEQISKVLSCHNDEHRVKPRLVKISNSTEKGTAYSKGEIQTIYEFCRQNNLLLYLDGARIGVAVAASGGKLSLADICAFTDAFYIGGTKNGAAIGEALIISNNSLKQDFRYHIKHRGAMLAKGRIIGIQFIELFKDGLYYELAAHALNMADKLREAFQLSGYKFYGGTNQIFAELPDRVVKRLSENFMFERWEEIDDGNSIIRLVTSWATEEASVKAFCAAVAGSGG